MGFLFPQRRISLTDAGVPSRRGMGSGSRVSTNDAMRISALWAATMLRAGLESTLPIDCFTRYTGSDRMTPVSTPDVLVTPDTWAEGQPMDITEWMHSTRLDLDRFGNDFGVITSKDGAGLPREIHLVSASDVTVKGKGSRVTKYRIDNTDYEPAEIWHERQYTEAGSPIGLSPIAMAARTLSAHTSALQFALDWFERGATPSMVLRNNARDFNAREASLVQRRVAASMSNGEPAAIGKSWEIDIQSARAKDVGFLALMDHQTVDISRFFGVPADLIDAAVSGQSITYANISERNLQFLIMNFGPAVTRREKALSRLVPGRGFVKLNTEGLLRMDPDKRRRLLIDEYLAGLKSKDEARGLENMGPLLEDESGIDEAERATAVARLLQMGYLAKVNDVISKKELRKLANRAGADLDLSEPSTSTSPTEGAS
ncbi:phage portal protein [Demequina sp. TTPB684]|uniref:phage portal protein n=1 Tax=unclassified Demequina TaxID=2620311 RepID=UPI001CF453F1|nr:phage portal protein [Demequina sp. TMPB413]MCB2413657.1 phage portal protein [Demequina sp. TTPB684]UPU87720.1 phage portal protein [Demequina sp. TMPB413]